MNSALQALRAVTEPGSLWLVGGCVRDELLGSPPKDDYDLVTEGDALAIAQAIWEAGVSEIAPVTYPRFGTAMVQVQGIRVELVSARRESYDSESRKPDVEPATLLEDAQRRDFTCNALLRNLHSGELFDPLGVGLEDLRSGILRTPLEPGKTFIDDPLRMLRAVRFKHRLQFEFAPGLAEAIRDHASRLRIISAERIAEELLKVLPGPNPDLALDELRELGLLAEFLPEALEMVGVEQGCWHHLDVWGHTLCVVREAPPEVRLAAFFHDIGKPQTRTVEDGAIRFLGHEKVGAEMAIQILRRLKFSNEDVHRVSLLVRHHMRIGSLAQASKSAYRRFLRDLGDLAEAQLDLCEADQRGQNPAAPKLDFGQIRARLAEVQTETPVQTLISPLTGEEIMEILQLPAGPQVGAAKSWLAEQVIEGHLTSGDRELARTLLVQHYKSP